MKRTSQSLKSGGFSLLELLVTLVVLSIGLLGLALMQTTGLGLTKSAYSRTQAMLLASDIADRIRANESYASNYLGSGTAGSSPGCIGGTTCTGPALAASDMTDWANRIQAEFPNGVGRILDKGVAAAACFGSAATAVPDGFMRVLITWSEANGTTDLTGGQSGGDCYQFDFVF